MAWTVAPNIKALFASVNKIAPGRDKASDGTIGDYAHSTGTSGHNPDDTTGTRAERSDSDTLAEVRAGDIDKDLRTPGLTMDLIAETIRTTPALRKRLIYIIWNRRIASASSGWVWKPYTGANPHDKHLHASGHPDYDNDSSPWREIEALGDDMSAAAEKQIAEMHASLQLLKDAAWVLVKGPAGSTAWVGGALNRIGAEVGISPDELAQISAAAREGAASAADELVGAVMSKLPLDATPSREDIEQAVRDAFAGGLAPETTPPQN